MRDRFIIYINKKTRNTKVTFCHLIFLVFNKIMIEEFEDISFENLMDEGFSVITEEIHDKNEQPNEEQESFPILPVKNIV